MKVQRVFFLFILPINLRILSATQNVVNADIIKISQNDQRFSGWYSFSVFVFRNQSLLNASMHLQCDLC